MVMRHRHKDGNRQNEECFHNLDDLRKKLSYLSFLSNEKRDDIKISSVPLSQLLETSELFENY